MLQHNELETLRRTRREERLWRAHDLLGARLELLWSRHGVSRTEQAARRRHLVERGILLPGMGVRVSWAYLTGPLPEARQLVRALEQDEVDAPGVDLILAALGQITLRAGTRAMAA